MGGIQDERYMSSTASYRNQLHGYWTSHQQPTLKGYPKRTAVQDKVMEPAEEAGNGSSS
jgi:hypothetical protein